MPGWDKTTGGKVAGKKAKKSKFWRTDWFAGLFLILAATAVYTATDFAGTLERRFYDVASTASGRQPSDRIAIIAIDDQSIANLGRWPWPRTYQANLIDLLAQAGAKTVVQTVFFFEPQKDAGLVYIQKLKELVGAADPAIGNNEGIARIFAEAETALDTDTALARSLHKAGNVVLPSVFVLGEPQGKPDNPLPTFVLSQALDETAGFSLPALRGQFPIELLGTEAAAVGHLNQFIDQDGAVRTEPLLVNYYGKAVPSVALLAAMKSLNLTPADIRLNEGNSVQLGRLKIKTDSAAMMLPQFYRDRDGRPAFQVDSFYDVVSGKIPLGKYTGKIVIIGATAAGVGVQFPVPGHAALSPAETIAHITSSILSEHFIVQPDWSFWVSLLALLLVGVYVIWVLPKLSAGAAALTTAGLLLVLISSEFGLLAAASIWLKLILPVLVLMTGHIGLTTKRFLVTEAGKVKSDEDSAETNRMMGLALQGQGQLDMAFDRFRRVPATDAVLSNLYSLALDFERKRQFNKAQAVYEHISAADANFKDIQQKLNRAKHLSETVILGGGSHPGGTMLLDGVSVEKPMLGRYQVEKELGKGAMGVVYQGKDPKIGRIVAIKTMALSEEFSGDDLVDARERFFREAETAGRLQHQNIVTIFDAGEEHDLAYIAMEFLKGSDLAEHTRPDNLLPVSTVISVVSRVAQALDYAHRQQVVHRDIKPANIMYARNSDTVKVTDFGIARITDSSKTKTGLVLGTPSFMSPEQLAGKRVDGRSDLYSLGVMLYQLLTGVLPFRGESMAELMYKIANEEAADIRIHRIELAESLAAVVKKAMAKQPDMRYQTGATFSDELLRCTPADGDSTPANANASERDMDSAFQRTDAFQSPRQGNATSFEATQVNRGPDIEI
jgi:CHASE2 domain-containing sensor protein/predicted Ser/Thr protein kinase